MVMKKKLNPISQGRKKIEMVKITKKSNLQVTFSKRRSGLFKKGSELCTLCGVEIAIIVFSPAHKPFCFGHPEVESIIDRFLISQNTSTNFGQLLYEPFRRNDKNIHELNKEFTVLVNQLEAEKKRGEELDNLRKASRNLCWWEAPIDELSLVELQQLKTYLEELKSNVTIQGYKIMNQLSTITNNSSQFFYDEWTSKW